MKFNVNNNNPLDPFNHKDNSLDPKNEKKKDLLNMDKQEIQLDPYGGRPPRKPKKKKEEKKSEDTSNTETTEKTSIEIIADKISLEKDNLVSSLTENVKENVKENTAQKKKAKEDKKPLNPNIKAFLVFSIPIFCLLIVVVSMKDYLIEQINRVIDDTYIESNLVMMPDVTGMEKEQALETLKNLGIRTETEYMYNQYFDHNTIIKCSVDPDNPVEKGSTIRVYICKDPNVTEIPKNEDFFKDIYLPQCPISKNAIVLTSVKLNDVYLTINFKNNSSKRITTLKYTLGFYDEAGNKLVNRTYTIENLTLNPQEGISDKIELKNANIKEITFEYAEFKYILE